MHEIRRICFLGVLTAVLFSGIISLAQAQQTDREISGTGSIVYLPAVFTPNCEDYFDDFSDPNSGWSTGENDDVNIQYIAGEYSIASKKSGVLGAVSPLAAREFYVAEVDAHFNGQPTDGFYGLMFGVKRQGGTGPITEYYLFAVDPDHQEYGLFYRNPVGSFTSIVPPTESMDINMGTAVNNLRAVLDNGQITLKVNDILLTTVTDNTISGPTQVGVAMRATTTNPEADARFDNFSSHICVLDEQRSMALTNRSLTIPNRSDATPSIMFHDVFNLDDE